MHTLSFSAFAACCALAVVVLLAIMWRNGPRYRGGGTPRHVYVRDCVSNAGIALVLSSLVLLRLVSLGAPTASTIVYLSSVVVFLAGVACVAAGFGLLVRENRRRI